MDFKSLSRLNVLINVISGNFLPVSNVKATFSYAQIIYSIIVWLIELSYIYVCILGAFNVTKQDALQNSTVNIVVSIEVVLLVAHLHSNKNLLRELIKKLNNLFTLENITLRNVVAKTVKPLEKVFQVYTVVVVTSVIGWTGLPLIKIYQKSKFYYKDYGVPAKFSNKEPFSTSVFVFGVLFEILAAAYIILKKTSLDVYMIHFIVLLTAQYRYLKIQLGIVVRDNKVGLSSYVENNDGILMSRESNYEKNSIIIENHVNSLILHHSTVIEITVLLKKLLSLNVGLIYVDSVFRFCFLGFMIVTITADFFGRSLIILYTIGALIQLYILCYCIEQLFEASTKVTDEAFYERWYEYDISLRKKFALITFANKLECKLSAFGNVNLTLSAFMSILNQAYSTCMLFLQTKH